MSGTLVKDREVDMREVGLGSLPAIKTRARMVKLLHTKINLSLCLWKWWTSSSISVVIIEDHSRVGGGGMMERPGWLEGLVGERFFKSCAVHQDRRKSEKNVFCLVCCFSLCTHCLPSHPSHPLLQVRRYVYHDVVRLDDLEKLIDCSYIQPYTINGGKVIFLNQRPQSRNYKDPSNICFHCERTLQEPFHFCSLQCKVDHLLDQGEDLSSILYSFHGADFTITQNFEGLGMECSSEVLINHGQSTPSSSFLDEDHHLMDHRDCRYKENDSTSCTSVEAMSNTLGVSPNAYQTTTATTRVKTKSKRSGNKLIPGIVLSLGNRRKGAPHRAPLS